MASFLFFVFLRKYTLLESTSIYIMVIEYFTIY